MFELDLICSLIVGVVLWFIVGFLKGEYKKKP